MFTLLKIYGELGKEQRTLCKRLLIKHYHDKGLLGWLDSGMAPPPPPPPRIGLGKQIGPEQWDVWKPAASTEELGIRPDISQRPVLVIVSISFAIISHILYRPVSHFLLLWP